MGIRASIICGGLGIYRMFLARAVAFPIIGGNTLSTPMMFNNLRKWAGGTAVAAAIGYVGLVLLLTYPAIFHLQDRLIGNNIDNWIFYWNNWRLSQAIAAGDSWFFTTDIFFPQGSSLIAHSNSFLSSLLAGALRPFVGPVAAFNLVWLWGLWLGAWGMFLLLHEMTKQPLAAFIAGFVFAFAPYHLTQYLAHMHLGGIHWWPFYILFLWRSLRQDGWGNVVFTAVFLALTFWTGFQLALLLVVWTAVFILWWGWHNSSLRWRHTVRQMLLLGGVTMLLCLPILWPVLANLSELAGRAAEFDESIIKQTDLLAYASPPTYQPLWGDFMVSIYQKFRVNQAFMPYLGIAVLLMSLLAVWKQPRKARFWLWSGLLWLLLSSGSVLRFNGTVYESIPLPYRLIQSVFPISTIRTPDRFNLLLVLSMAVLVGLAAAWLLQRRWGHWLLPFLSLVLLLDFLPTPLPMWELPPQSAFFDELALLAPSVGVVDYPMGYTVAKQWLYYQTLHGQPMVEGHVSRYTPDTYSFIEQQPILQRLYGVGEQPVYLPQGMFEPISDPLVALGPALRQLSRANVRTILLHRSFVTPEQLAYFEAQLPLVPIYKDDTLLVYDVDRPRPWAFQPTISLQNGVELVEVTVTLHDETVQVDLLSRLKRGAAVGERCAVEIVGETAVSPTISFFTKENAWQGGDLAHNRVTLPLPENLQPGNYSLQFACANEETAALAHHLLITANEKPRLMGHLVNLDFGEAIRLQEARVWQKSDQLYLSLRWLAVVEPQRELKVFVHLLDETGALVRQLDIVPCNWQCPTSQWQVGQTVTDEMTLDLWGLPSGDYQISLGMYDVVSGERLIIGQGVRETAVVNNTYLLPHRLTITSTP